MDLVNRRGIIAAIAIAVAAIMVPAVALASATHGRPALQAVPQCKAANIEVWLGLNPDGAAAGTTFYPIEFSNSGFQTHTCWIAGSPAVVAINSANKKIGPAVKASTKGT
jgi:hypothetical protein